MKSAEIAVERPEEAAPAALPKDQKKRYNLCIENGDIDGAITSIPTETGAKLPAGVPNLCTYLSNNRHRMSYKQLKQSGITIGSGAVESGNKKVIQQRMKQSGMRWGVPTGQTIASLRAKSSSGRWSDVERILHAA